MSLAAPPGAMTLPRTEIDVAVAPLSQSNFYTGLDGTLGVFWATYDPVEPGTRVLLHLHFPGDLTLSRDAIATWTRADVQDGWPGVALMFEQIDPYLRERFLSFSRFRRPMHASARQLREEALAQRERS